MARFLIGTKNVKKRRAAWATLTNKWDSTRWSRYWRGGHVTKQERKELRSILRPNDVPSVTTNPAETVRVQPPSVSDETVARDVARSVADAALVQPLSEAQPEDVGMIDAADNSGTETAETTSGNIFNDAFDTAKKKGVKRGKKAASNYFNRVIGSVFGDDDDDRPAWQKYGWSGKGGFASQVAEGNEVTDRSRRVLLTGYVDAQGTKAWVGKHIRNKRTGRKTGKQGTARELYDARMDAIRQGLIEESAITDPSFEYGTFRDISVRDIPASSGEDTPTTGIGDNLVVPDDDDFREQLIDMFDDLYRPGADDGSAGGGMSDTNTVGAGVEPTPKMPVGMSMTGIGLIAIAAVGLLFLARR